MRKAIKVKAGERANAALPAALSRLAASPTCFKADMHGPGSVEEE